MSAMTAEFACSPTSVAAARHFVVRCLTGTPPSVCERAALLVSELATNAVKHARSAFSVSVRLGGGPVRVSVRDFGEGEPTERRPAPDQTSGRGLMIVGALADQWGVEDHARGKTVWFELAGESPVRTGRSRRARADG